MIAEPLDAGDVERLAKLAGLAIDPAYLPGVASNLATLLGYGAMLMQHELPADIEPAEVFAA